MRQHLHAAFVREYVLDWNAEAAAQRAGHSPKAANRSAYALLARPEIQMAIGEAVKKREKELAVEVQDVIRELMCHAFYDPADLVRIPLERPSDIASLPEEVRRCITGWSFDRHGNMILKLSEKTKSLELLGRHLGMWKDRTVLENPDGTAVNPVVVYLPDNGRDKPKPTE